MRIAALAALLLAIAAFLCAALLAGLPWLLRCHEYRLRTVVPRFRTPIEQYERAAQATLRGDTIFNALYDPMNNEQIDAYVPPRASFAYWILRFISADNRLAAKEDFLPAPPAPMAFEFIDKEMSSPLRVSVCDERRMEWLFTILSAGTLFLIALFALKRIKASRAQPTLNAGLR